MKIKFKVLKNVESTEVKLNDIIAQNSKNEDITVNSESLKLQGRENINLKILIVAVVIILIIVIVVDMFYFLKSVNGCQKEPSPLTQPFYVLSRLNHFFISKALIFIKLFFPISLSLTISTLPTNSVSK